MKTLLLLIPLMCTAIQINAQDADTTAQPETFEYEWAGEK